MGKTKAETLAKQQRCKEIREENRIKALEDPYWNYWKDRKHVNRISVRLTEQQEHDLLQRRIKASNEYHRQKAESCLVTSSNNNDSDSISKPVNIIATKFTSSASQPLRYDCQKCGKNLSVKSIHRSSACSRRYNKKMNVVLK